MLELTKTIGPIIVGLAAIVFAYFFNIRQLKQKHHEDERREIYKKLNAFYGPLQQLLGQSGKIYQLFTIPRKNDFRTLIFLLKGNKFKGNDKILIEEVMKITEQAEDLIYSQSGLIDDPDLRQLLIKIAAHFRILRFAYKGTLTGEIERFKEYVYPKKINQKVENRIKELQKRLDELNKI